MSLKAKIEAVIYASEEPVTLAQLISLLGQEGQAEVDRLQSAQQTLALDPNSSSPEPSDTDSDMISAADINVLAAASSDDDTSDPGELVSEEPLAGQAEPEASEQAETTPETSHEPETAEATPEPAPDEKQLARLEKDRARHLREYFRHILDQLIAEYTNPSNDRGLEIREVAGGFRFATKPEYHDAVRGFVKSLKPPLKLTLQALETLAVVAYKQPVTAPEISEIRGVDSSGVLGSLISRKLIATAGRKQVIGRPILYKTTRDFLLRFGLKDVNELPSIEEFEKLAGELADSEAVQEEIQMSQPETEATEDLSDDVGDDLDPGQGIEPSQADGDSTPLDVEEFPRTEDDPVEEPELVAPIKTDPS